MVVPSPRGFYLCRQIYMKCEVLTSLFRSCTEAMKTKFCCLQNQNELQTFKVAHRF